MITRHFRLVAMLGLAVPLVVAAFSWPGEASPSHFFAKLTSLPRQDVVEQIRAVVEPVTKEALTQLTPEVVRQFSSMPKEDLVKYVVGVLEPATKTVISGVTGIVEPAAASLSRLLNRTRTRLQGGARVVLKPAVQGLGSIAAPALNEVIVLIVDGVRLLWRNSFEPLNVEHMELHFKEPILQADLTLDELQINNASTFVLDVVRSEPENMAANFSAHVDAFNVTGIYDINGVFARENKVFGAGNFTVVVHGLRINGRVELGIKDMFLKVDDLKLDISIKALKVKLEHLLGQAAVADLASGVISDVGPDFLEEFRPEVGAMISGQIKEFANKLLSSLSLTNILDRIRVHTESTASKRLHLRNRPYLYRHQELEALARQESQANQDQADKTLSSE